MLDYAKFAGHLAFGVLWIMRLKFLQAGAMTLHEILHALQF